MDVCHVYVVKSFETCGQFSCTKACPHLCHAPEDSAPLLPFWAAPHVPKFEARKDCELRPISPKQELAKSPLRQQHPWAPELSKVVELNERSALGDAIRALGRSGP